MRSDAATLYLFEFSETPFVVFARVVAGEVGGCDMCDCFCVHANDLLCR